jgi:hypothetical protein
MIDNPNWSKEAVYPIQGDYCLPFITGQTAKGEQVLMGVHDNGLVAIFFDDSGQLNRVEQRELPSLPRYEQVIQDATLQRKRENILGTAIETWQTDISLATSTIKVRHFFLPDLRIGIAQFPDPIRQFLTNPNYSQDDRMRKHLNDRAERWIADGQFVLWWKSEHWMSCDGEVTDT